MNPNEIKNFFFSFFFSSRYVLSLPPKAAPKTYNYSSREWVDIYSIGLLRLRRDLDLPSLDKIAVKRGRSRSSYKSSKLKLLLKYYIWTRLVPWKKFFWSENFFCTPHFFHFFLALNEIEPSEFDWLTLIRANSLKCAALSWLILWGFTYCQISWLL